MPNDSWHTKVKITPASLRISHADCIFTIGSCFSENIGVLLNRSGFQVYTNPFGILFNPVSIHKTLDRILNLEMYSSDDLIQFNDRFISLDHHSSFSGPSREGVVERINSVILQAHEFLLKSRVLCITFGSAWAYEHVKTQDIVANCHKIPQKEFTKVLVGHERIEATFSDLFHRLVVANPSLEIIVTVSPVRHWKDGAEGNSLSKSHLRIASSALTAGEGHHYFPAYEIMCDELRDYRFYKEDMLHPSHAAVQYIWEKFRESFMESDTRQKADLISKHQLTLDHISDSKESQELRNKVREQIAALLNG